MFLVVGPSNKEKSVSVSTDSGECGRDWDSNYILAFKRWRNIYFFISGGQEEKTGTDAGY